MRGKFFDTCKQLLFLAEQRPKFFGAFPTHHIIRQWFIEELVVAPAKQEEVEVEATLEGIDADAAEQSEEESSGESEPSDEDQSE